MDDRATVRVPAELKDKLEKLKSDFRASSVPAAIEKLITDRQLMERQRVEDRKRQEADMLDVGHDLKEQLSAIGRELGLRSDADAMGFLIAHYRNSDTISKATMIAYKKLLDR